MKLYDAHSAEDYYLDGRKVRGMNWHDARTEKPPQGKEVILWLDTGEQHVGFWLLHANKYVRNVRKWKIYHGNHLVEEDKVIGWRNL